MVTETATIQVAGFDVKEGAKDGRPWKRWTLKDGNGEFYSTFIPAVGELIGGFEGRQARIEWAPKGKFKDLVSISDLQDGDEPPALGTGDYVRGQTAPTDKRSIWASVALNDAARARVGADWKEIEALANEMFVWLLRKNNAVEDDDIPF